MYSQVEYSRLGRVWELEREGGDDQIKESEMGMTCRMHSKQTIYTQNFGCKNLRKWQLEKANCRCEDNIKMDLNIFAPGNPDGYWISNLATFT